MLERSSKVVLSLAVLLVAACSGEAQQGATSEKPTATATAPAPTSSSSTAGAAKIPLVVVDDQGPIVGGQRAWLDKPGWEEKLKRIVAEVPEGTTEIPLTIEKRAKMKDVNLLVRELGARGVSKVRVTADARGDLPKEIVVTPQSKASGTAEPCSIVGMIAEGFHADVWSVKGTTAKRAPKGLAGPDMSVAGAVLEKELKKCESKIAFFSADWSLPWEYGHMIGGAISAADKEKKIVELVLLDEVPVSGKPIKAFAK